MSSLALRATKALASGSNLPYISIISFDPRITLYAIKVKKASGGEIVDQVRHNRSLDEANRHVLDVNPLQVAVVVIDRVGSVLADAAFSHVIRARIV